MSTSASFQSRAAPHCLAAEALKEAIALQPKDALSHRTLGIILCTQERYDAALEPLKRATELNPKDATAYRYLGLAYAQKARLQEAAKALEAADALEPQTPAPAVEKNPLA